LRIRTVINKIKYRSNTALNFLAKKSSNNPKRRTCSFPNFSWKPAWIVFEVLEIVGTNNYLFEFVFLPLKLKIGYSNIIRTFDKIHSVLGQTLIEHKNLHIFKNEMSHCKHSIFQNASSGFFHDTQLVPSILVRYYGIFIFLNHWFLCCVTTLTMSTTRIGFTLALLHVGLYSNLWFKWLVCFNSSIFIQCLIWQKYDKNLSKKNLT
jgi:hypothetical protein